VGTAPHDTAAMNSSSPTCGMHMAILKGQPSKPPRANQKTPSAVRKPRRRLMNAAVPSMVVHIAKVDGRNVAAAWNIPALAVLATR